MTEAFGGARSAPSRLLAAAPTAARVRFARSDLALYWGYVQGADRRTLHETYFPGEPLADLRHVRARARVIAQELSAAARRSEKAEYAPLFLRDPAAIAGAVTAAPTLDQFRAQTDPDGFYSEHELQELWTEQYGGDASRRAEARRARLRTRIREALAWIETEVFPVPRPAHRVDAWLPLGYATRLEVAGLGTIAQLVAAINTRGRNWHRRVPGIGPAKAREIEQWVLKHERPGDWALLPSSKLSVLEIARVELTIAPPSGVVPLDRIELPAALDGSQGQFRAGAGACTLTASNDLDAIKAWISAKASPHTQRAYTREAERLLLWCLLVLGKPMSSMTVEDCDRYRAFLRDPQPAHQWCAPRGTPRWSRDWGPFEAPLTAAGERHALVILKSMGTWLKKQNYVVANPWAALGVASASRTTLDKRRAFTLEQWRLIRDELDRLTDTGARPRLKFVIWLLYGTGLRLEEAVTCRLKNLIQLPLSDGSAGWWLKVTGKRGKDREVPLGSEVVRRLTQYLATRAIESLDSAPPDAFILARSTDKDVLPMDLTYEEKGGIAAGTLYRQVKAFFKLVAKRCESDEPATAARLRRASTHWLRHTFGTRIVALTKDVTLGRDLLGHASVATTSIYLDGDEIQQQRAVEELLSSS